jgi:S-layer protein
MSENKTAYINAYMQTLAGEGIVLTPRLVEVFSGVLSRQLIEDAEGNITQKTNFETLAKIFTFVATPADERPASPNSYTAEQIAAAQEAAEQAVSPVDPDTFTLAEALALGEDLPDTYHIVDALVTDPVTSDVAGLEDAVAAAAENYVYSTAEQAIIDGAETVDISFDVPYILADTLANLAAAEEGVLAGAESYSLTETEFAVPEAVESTVAGLGAALAEAVTGFFTAAEQAIIDGASNGEDVTIDVPYILADTLANLAAADAEVLADAESYSLTETEFVVADSVESTVAGLDDAIAAAVDGYFTEAEQAVIDGASNGDEVVVTVASYALVDTLANIQGADADVLNGAESYTIEDTADNLVAATNVQQILILADAEAINVTGDATVAQMNELINESGYTNIGTYTLRDTAENLLAEENADIVAGAEEAFVEGEPTLTIAEYDEISAVATVEVWNIEDTADNILAAGAENAALAGADAIFATDVADLDQAFELDALGLDVGYDPYESTLEEALDAENLPNNYTIEPATPYDAGDLTVAEAEEQLAEAEGILEGAQNADELVLANLFGYNLADTLENLAAAAEDILADAGQYALTDEAGDLGEISGDEYQLILGAANEADYTYTVEPATIVSISADAASVTEGGDMVFTVELSHAVNVARTIEYKIEGVTTDVLNPAEPMNDFGFTFGQFDVPADATEVTFNLTPLSDGVTEGPEGFRVLLLDESLSPLPNGTTDTLIVRDEPGAGRNIDLTTDPDNIAPGAGNDVITGIASDDGAGNYTGTLSTLDSIDPGASSYDILKINDTTTSIGGGFDVNGIAGLNIMNVNEFQIRSADDFTMNTTDFAGTELVKVLQGNDIDLTAGADTAVDVTGIIANGSVAVKGGSTQTINVNKAGIGIDLHDAEGAVDVTSSKQTGDILIDGGSDVTVVATSDKAASGHIKIGEGASAGAAEAPAGAVSVTQNLTSDGTVLDNSAKVINVTGGTTVNVAINAENIATKAGMDADIRIGAVKVVGDGETTEVTVTQTKDNQTFTTPTVAEVKETTTITFNAMTKGQTLQLISGNTLTFTASKNLTAAEVAQAFSNLANDDRQDAGGPVANGVYTGQFSAEWSSAEADGNSVVFTAISDNETDITFGGTATAPTQVKAAGTAASGGVATTNAIDYGDVRVDGNATASIESITLDGYASADLGKSGTDLNALKTLSLANSGGAAEVATSATALDLTVNNVKNNVDLDQTGATITDLDLTATGAASAFNLIAINVENLNLMAAVNLDLNTATFTGNKLETVEITGTGAVILPDISGHVGLNSFDASGNTGGVTTTIEGGGTTLTGDIEEYIFSDGNDDVTVEDADGDGAVDVKVSLGAGDDKLTLDGGIDTAGAMLDGGTGTNTLHMDAADAETASGGTAFQTKFTNFQKLSVGNAAGQEVVDLDNMNDIDYVILGTSAGTAQTATVTVTQGTAEAGDIFTVTINGKDFVYTTVGTEADDKAIADAIAALINADATLGVGAGAGTAFTPSVITLTAAVAGVPFTVAVDLNDGGTADADLQTAAGTANAYGITLDNMADDGTVELTGLGTVLVNMMDASGGEDVLNTKLSGNIANYGALTADGVETFNIAADGTGVSALNLFGDAIKTIVADGAGDLALTTHSDVLELVNASEMTGDLTASADVDEMTLLGGKGDDTLTANASEVEVKGGVGDDTIIITDEAQASQVWGDEGNDTFNITDATLGKEAYATIMDVNSGDSIVINAGTFLSKGVVVADPEAMTLTDWFTAAFNQTDAGEAIWFEHNSNTYIVDNANTNDFDVTDDVIVKIVGSWDLENGASFNATINTLEIA